MVMWFLHCPGTTTVSNSSQIQVVSWFARRNQWTIPNSWPQQGDFGSWFQMVLPCFTWNMVKLVVNVRWFLWMTMQRKCEKGWFRELILTFDGVCSGFWSFRSYILFCKIIYLRIGSGFWDFLQQHAMLFRLFPASNQWPPQHLSWWWCSLEVQHKFLEHVQAQVAQQTSVSFFQHQ